MATTTPTPGAGEVTVSCPELLPDGSPCPWAVTAPETGKGSASWRLGTHRYQKHGYRNPAPAKANRGKADPPATEGTGATMLRVVGSAAGEGRGRGVPTTADLTRGLGRGVYVATVVAASYAAETDDTLTTEAERDALVADLALSQRGAEDLTEPIARAIAPTGVNKRYGRAVIDNIDAVASFGELVKLGMRWRRYFRLREQREAARALGAGAPGPGVPVAPGVEYVPPAGPTVPAASAPPLVVEQAAPAPPPPAPPAAPAAPPAPPSPAVAAGEVAQAFRHDGSPAAPTTGALVTPEMVRAMRAGQ